ncbi:MAG: glycosyltransferase family 2 protein [Xenococcaceae cyanobacterium MO_167.B27]|nr:glycosyltransferase family 2 protein [Xenococcaceae cyanobacterium MO_167.B27]
MSDNRWEETESAANFDPLGSFLSEWSDPEDEEEEFRSDFFQGLAGRRKKAALVFMTIWIVVITLHLVSWGYWLVIGITGLLGIHIVRFSVAPQNQAPEKLSDESLANAPTVSLLVSAKNEEAVIEETLRILCNLDYPQDKYEVWAIDDRSTDQTPEILDKLALEYPQLLVVHRSAAATGGKSGALNQVLPHTKGEIIAVFDADARVETDLLRKVVPMFDESEIGAVQVRKAVSNELENFWTKGQAAEMALDSYFQQQRIAVNGIGELRGNGQFVRRSALKSCGGWNEETITDDLDLTIRLHLDNWKIGFLLTAPVKEEGVTRAVALWHQRNRWAEGGYQRYLDYWRYIFRSPMGFTKRIDLLCFVLFQYILPTATIPDLVITLTRHKFPVLAPLSSVLLSVTFMSMCRGLIRIKGTEEKLTTVSIFKIVGQTIRGMIYMVHWQIVMPSITARMSVRPKQLKWVKTVHEGAAKESFEF